MIAAAGWALLAASSLVLGAVLALWRPFSARTIGNAMAFGGGALLGSLAYELIPGSNISDLVVWACFGLGALTYFVADGLVESRVTGGGTAIALGALLDGVPESIVLGMTVAIDGRVSVGFLAAVFVSNVPESLSSAGAMRREHSSRTIYRLWLGIAAASGLAGGLGYLLANVASDADGRYVQAFAGGAVLTMLADSMLPEAFKEGGRVVGLVTALGFGAAALLTLVG